EKGSQKNISMETSESKVVIRRIRVRKEDSAYLYCIFEAQEGALSYSTLPHQNGEATRDLVLSIPVSFNEQVTELLKELSRELEIVDLPVELNASEAKK